MLPIGSLDLLLCSYCYRSSTTLCRSTQAGPCVFLSDLVYAISHASLVLIYYDTLYFVCCIVLACYSTHPVNPNPSQPYTMLSTWPEHGFPLHVHQI